MSDMTPVVSKHSGAPFDIYIGRGSIWGNPFPMGKAPGESRADVIRRYEGHLLGSSELLSQVQALHGQRLQCFCAPQPCHGDVLAHYADAFATTGHYPVQSAFQTIYP